MNGHLTERGLQPESQTEIIHRLRCAEGHFRAVIRMLEAGEPCEVILHQLDAVQAALKVIENQIVRHLVQQNTSILQDQSSEGDRMEAFEELTELFQRLRRANHIWNPRLRKRQINDTDIS